METLLELQISQRAVNKARNDRKLFNTLFESNEAMGQIEKEFKYEKNINQFIA